MPAAYKLYSRLQSFRGNSGELLAGGTLNFTVAGDPNTPKNVYAEEAMSTNNGSVVTLDASGRPGVAIWGSGEYDVYLKDSDGVAAGEDLNVKIPGGDAAVLPTLNPGEFLSGDGSVYIAVDLSSSLLPDQTGHSNKVLGTDGSTASWIAKPADGADGAAGVSDLAAVGLSGKTIRTGAATGTNAGGRTQSVSVTYATPLAAAADFIGIHVTNSALSSYGNSPSWRFTTSSATGFTVMFTMGELDDSQSGFDFNAGVAFRYWAIGNA